MYRTVTSFTVLSACSTVFVNHTELNQLTSPSHTLLSQIMTVGCPQTYRLCTRRFRLATASESLYYSAFMAFEADDKIDPNQLVGRHVCANTSTNLPVCP